MEPEDEQDIIREAMRLLGSRTSDKKKKASAENGKKGGRPRKPPTDDHPDQPKRKPGRPRKEQSE